MKRRGRMSITAKLGLLAGLAAMSLAAAPRAVRAQGQPTPPVTIQKVTDNVYRTVGGAGSNIGIIIGKDGVILVDAKITPESAKEALVEIAKLTPKPVTTAIITHSDLDHVNGLASFPKGITVIAQEGCKKEMEESLSTPRPAPRDFLPNKTVKMKEKMTISGVRFEFRHYAPAHTNGDLIIYLPEQKIIFTGDIINPTNAYTGIHPEKNGSIEGWFKTVKGMLALKGDTFIPGHGDTQTRAGVEAKLAKVQGQYDKIKALVAQKKTLPEVRAALGEPAPVAGANGALPPATFTEIVYKELTVKS
jgi:cyclase